MLWCGVLCCAVLQRLDTPWACTMMAQTTLMGPPLRTTLDTTAGERGDTAVA
jgi:hypothetical protein